MQQLDNDLPSAVPQASGPFPGFSRSAQTTAFVDESDCYFYTPGILAQHASGVSDQAYPGGHSTTLRQASDSVTAQTGRVHDQTGFNSPTGPLCGQGLQGNENWCPGFAPVLPRYVTPHPPLSETTATNAKTEGAYVSFDEWQAQVRSKQVGLI